MSLNSIGGIASNVDFDETLECFFQRNPALFRKFVNELHEKQLCRRLAEVAIEKRILRPNIISKIRNNPDGACYLVNEFNRVCVTVGFLHKKCLAHHEFQHLSILLGVFEIIQIIKQPGESSSPLKTVPGGELKLTFLVKGCPSPTYQWFHNGSPIPCATESSHTVSYFSKQMEGRYHCVAVQNCSTSQVSLVSNVVQCVLILREPFLLMDLPPEIVCFENEEANLFVRPDPDFLGSYEWLFSNKIVPQKNSNVLCIKHVTKHDEGVYRCVLKNSAGETYSNFCRLKVEPPQEQPIKTKVALLIGNSEYFDLSKLKTPSADVRLLAHCLKKMGFFVISLTNLNEIEFKRIISWFHSIIPKKAVVFFFFSGHGFELMKNKFLLPVDCPPNDRYSMRNCVSYQYIIQQFIIRKPLLLILVLDMCLKGPNRTDNPCLYEEHIEHYDYDLSHSIMIEACATSDNQLAYERSTDVNGLYSRCLCDRIIQDLPILKNFEQAHKDFAMKGKTTNQSPQLKYNDRPIDFKLNARSQKGWTRRVESKIVRSLPDFFIVKLKNIGIYVLFVLIPDELILNSIDIFILPLSEISHIDFTLICKEAHFWYEGTMSNKSENLLCSKITINSLQIIEAMRSFHFKCFTVCDIEEKTLSDYAEIVIKPPLILCNT